MATLTINNAYCGSINIEYGLLYNWYTVADDRKITSSDDWSVPMDSQFDDLITYLGGAGSVAAISMKESGLTYWNTDNGLNTSNLNMRGAGGRNTSGLYIQLKTNLDYWASNEYNSTSGNIMNMTDPTPAVHTATGGDFKSEGHSIILVSDATGRSDGDIAIYTGNDGQVYTAVAINELYWTQQNLIETKFRDGSIIPFHGVDNDENFTNAEWAALTTAGVCAYNNDLSNAAPGFSWPTS